MREIKERIHSLGNHTSTNTYNKTVHAKTEECTLHLEQREVSMYATEVREGLPLTEIVRERRVGRAL